MGDVPDYAQVGCQKHLIEKGMLAKDATVVDADAYWEKLDEDCDLCSVHDDCPIYLEDQE